MQRLLEVVSKPVEERLVEANAPKKVGSKAAPGDGAAESLKHYGLLGVELSFQPVIFPVSANSWNSDEEPVFADLKQRRDLHLLCDGFMIETLQHLSTQHVLELGFVLL